MQLRHVTTPLLDIGYFEAGEPDAPVAVLVHGFPYDAYACVEAGEQLAAQGWHVLAPWLRGYGPTRFLSPATIRSGEQAALGSDLLAFLDALNVERATMAGYDWGGRTTSVVAAMWPERVAGLITGNGYNIFSLEQMLKPAPPEEEWRRWLSFYFHSPRGEAGLTEYKRPLLRQVWQEASPKWRFDNATFERSAPAFDNPDFVSVVIHSYRHRFGLAPGDPQYAELAQKLSTRPVIKVPTVVLVPDNDAFQPHPQRGSGPDTSRFAQLIALKYVRSGHNLIQENPAEVIDAFRLFGRAAH